MCGESRQALRRVTGWYGRSAGLRQAEAARHAGDRQADALLESVRLTIQSEQVQRSLAQRRQIYVEFLGAAEARALTERTGKGGSDDEALLQRTLSAVVLEGPPGVAAAARHLVDCLRRHELPDDVDRAKSAFVAVVQEKRSGPGEPA
ncbi:hypothetical protein [Streptomyces sp. NPDC020489]|uniref:hypothetical protein n=1 Tax=Streptomyces sp. NPDC020489 TaxID=3365077 RepID=UPI0037A7B162